MELLGVFGRKLINAAYMVLRDRMSIEKWQAIQNAAFQAIWYKQGSINREVFDDYSASTAIMVESLLNSGLEHYNVLSVGGCVSHIVPLLPMFNKFIHCTMIPIEEKEAIRDLLDKPKLQEYQGDFFDIEGDDNFEDVNFCISHVTLHCMNDIRYHNMKGYANNRPYTFASHLSQLCPNVKGVVLSVDVAEVERLQDNNVVLSEGKLLDSFKNVGFNLKKVVYDKYSTRKDDNLVRRITKEFPHEYCKKTGIIVATYCFEREVVKL